MTFEPPQFGLPPHVVSHILVNPSRWTKKGDLLKKQLRKLTTNETAINNFLTRHSVGSSKVYFPIAANHAPRLDTAKYPTRNHYEDVVPGSVYALVVIP
jgi:hypothetical protein